MLKILEATSYKFYFGEIWVGNISDMITCVQEQQQKKGQSALFLKYSIVSKMLSKYLRKIHMSINAVMPSIIIVVCCDSVFLWFSQMKTVLL